MAITTSVLTGGTNSHQTTSEEVNYRATDFYSAGCVGTLGNTGGVGPATGAFALNAQAPPDMTLAVSAGVAYVTATPSGGNSQLLRVKNSAVTSTTIAANTTGGTRYDWIYLKIDATAAANPAVDASDVASLVSSRSTSATTDNGTPPTYGTLLGVVTVANGASSISAGNIADRRNNSVSTASGAGWNSANEVWTYSSYDSTNKTAVFTVPTDATAKYSAGMRVAFYQSTQQYGIVTKVAATALTVYTGTDYSLTNADVLNPQYSSVKAPLGFPLDPTKWTVRVTYTNDNSTTSTTYAQVGTHQIGLPIGCWTVFMQATILAALAGNNSASGYVALSTATNSASDTDLTNKVWNSAVASLTGTTSSETTMRKVISTTVATTYYQIFKRDTALTWTVRGSDTRGIIEAVNAYL